MGRITKITRTAKGPLPPGMYTLPLVQTFPGGEAAWELTTDESRILGLIRHYYGPQNDLSKVCFTKYGAVIMVTDVNGVVGILVNLTVIPQMQKLEAVADEEVFNRYFCPPGTLTIAHGRNHQQIDRTKKQT
jgi:hypothetical protein